MALSLHCQLPGVTLPGPSGTPGQSSQVADLVFRRSPCASFSGKALAAVPAHLTGVILFSDRNAFRKRRKWTGHYQVKGQGLTAVRAVAENASSPAGNGRAEDDVDGQARVSPSMGRQELGSPVYRDSPTDLAFINACRVTFGRLAGWQSERSWEEGYRGMVEVSQALMRGRSAKQQQEAVLQGFPRVPDWFRRLFPYSDWGAELNARITPLFFSWLVGPCKVESAEVGGKQLRSVVNIERCRYLDTSGCTGMCVNMCKVPTQYFFTHELGMPLTMEPNFETLGCRMIFGQAPPPLEEDPALKQSCFASCPAGSLSRPSCPKLE